MYGTYLLCAPSQRRRSNGGRCAPASGPRKERDMPLNPSFIVRIGKKPGAFGNTMNEIRSWLDYRHIYPASFAPVAPADSGVGFEISFNSEDEARLFERAFRASTR